MKKVVLMLAVLAVAPAYAQDPANADRCSNLSLKGRYGVALSGHVLRVGEANGVGTFTADGNGALSGTVTANVAGVVLTGPLTGTYHVNDDCTGTGTVTCTNLGISGQGSFVIAGNQQKVFLMYVPSEQQPALGIASAVAERQ